MPRRLSLALMVTDIAFLLYWSMSLLIVTGLLHVPRDWMYEGFDQPRVMAWNWSFLPVDLGFSLTGLYAVRAARRGDPTWRPMALLSLTLTVVAGAMAIGYWILLGQFDPGWFLPNLLLVIWPLPFIAGLVCELGGPARSA